MELSINTPALLFPAITLLLLAYTNRFVAIANLIRKLHEEYLNGKKDGVIEQISNLRKRIHYIRTMQALGVLSFLCCVVCMFTIYKGWTSVSEYIFAGSLLSLLASLLLSLLEIYISTEALELELGDMETKEKSNFFTDFLKGGAEKKDL